MCRDDGPARSTARGEDVNGMTPPSTHPSTTARRVSINALSNVAVVAVDMVIGFLLLRFILSQMSLSEYGIWELTGAIFVYSPLLQIGLNSAVNYHVPKLLTLGDYDEISKVVSTAGMFYICSAVVVGAATLVLAMYFPIWFKIEPQHATISRVLVALVGGYFMVAVPLSVYQGILSGLQRYVDMNAVRLVTHVARAGLIVVALLLGYGLIGLGVVHVATRLIESAAMPLLVRRALPQVRLSYRRASLATLKMMWGYAVNTFLWGAAVTIISRSGLWVIGVYLTTRDATLYGAVLLLVSAFAALGQSLAAVTKPAASALQAENRLEQIQALALRGSRLVGLILWPAGAVMVIFGTPFLKIWLGNEFEIMGGILAMVVAGQILFDGQRVTSFVLIGLGKHRPFGVFTLGSAIIGVVTSIVLVSHYAMGLWGVAIGQVVALILVSVVFVPPYAATVLKIPLHRHLMASLARPMLASLPYALLLLFVRSRFEPKDLLSLVTVLLACVPLLLPSIWFIGMARPERKVVLDALKRFRSKRR